MAKNRQVGKLRFMTWLLAFFMLIASCALFFTACSEAAEEEEEETTETPTDTQTFANGNFEFFNDGNGAYLICTPNSWTSSTQGSTSLSKSGIVDTSLDWGEKFIYARTEYEKQQDDENTEEEPDEYYTDIDNDYDVPGWDLANAEIGEDDDDLTYEDLSAADIDAVNPGTHNVAPKTEDEENGTHVLMLHNYRSNGYGTAARYASSSVTVPAGAAVTFSVWVKTYGMTFNENTPVDGSRGAYIEVANTVGGTQQDPLVIQNIDTAKLNPDGDDNGWVQYSVYLKASSYASSSFTVYLGLGRTTEVSDNNFEYVQGYAFFDDLTYEVMTAAEYDEAVAEGTVQTALDIYSKNSKKYDTSSETYQNERAYALDLDVLRSPASSFTVDTVTVEETTSERNGKVYGLDDYFDASAIRDGQDAARSGLKTAADITADNGYASSVVEDFAKYGDLFGNDGRILMLYSGLGAPYTAEIGQGDLTAADTDLFTLAKNEHLMLRFFVKTSELNGATGATVTLVDHETETAIGALDTTTIDPVDLKDDTKTQEDIFDGWQQCYLYVTNDTDREITFTLRFNFGATDIVDTSLDDYTNGDGYAAFTGFEYAYLTEQESSLAATGTYAVKVSLTGSTLDADSTVVFDDTAYAGSTEGAAAIESGFADLRNYDGVYGNSKYVGGSETETGRNSLETAGLINKKYAANYWGEGDAPAASWIATLANSYTTALDKSNWWNTVIGSDATQPLLIVNTLAEAADSYGFVGAPSSVSADAYTQINLRIKLSEGAKAYIYLIDTDSEEDETKYTDALGYASGVSYRYDEDGNIVVKDPHEHDFDKETDILFYRQDNGLWSTSERHGGGAYYANLANYEADEDGNLTDGDGNIVYYLYEGAYYRYHDEDGNDYSLEVKDLTDAGVDADKLAAATLQGEMSKSLTQVIEGTADNAGKWIYVNFFLANGSESKNYRLEVWNGSRDNAEKMAANSYVIFDKVSYSTLDESTFTSMVSESLEALGASGKFNGTVYATAEEILEAYREDPSAFSEEADGTSILYYYFSLFDDKSYAPYDGDNELETREADPYSGYDPSTYADTVSYLKYNISDPDDADYSGYIEYNTFVDFGASEIAVETSESDTDEDTDTSTDDTHDHGDTNLWLLIPSIVLAAALFLTLISLLVKRLLSNIRKNRSNYTTQYDARRTRYVRKLKLAESSEDEPDAKSGDVLPEEDEIGEDEIYQVENDPENPYSNDAEADGEEKDDGNN